MEAYAVPRDIARVHIIDIPFSADKLYDYFIPPELRERVFEGSLVSVPFGPSNRKMNAVVWEINDRSELEGLKPISSVSSEEALLDESARSLCEFLKSYTLCTVGEAVRTVVPSAAFSKITEYIEETGKDHSVSDGRLNERSLAVLSYVKANSPVTVAKLKAEFGEDVSKSLLALIKASLVNRKSEVKGASKAKTELSVTLAVTAEKALNTASGCQGSVRVRSPMQCEVLKALAASGEMTLGELSAATGCTKVHVSALEKKRLVLTKKNVVFRNPYKSTPSKKENIVLSEEQAQAYEKLEALYRSPEPKAALLFGVTGSGKTSVIKKMIDRVREDGKGVIMLVPEIALTPQAVSVFCGYYGESVSVLHSSLSNGERYDAWRRIRDGLSDIVIGTRSAIFAPLKNIGLIVIDEEQEHTYKSDSDPKYSAHDVARFRCGKEGTMMLLASATPSLATYYKAASGKYALVEMNKRYGGATLPKVKICDMRRESASGNVSPLSLELIGELTETIENEKQAIVFLNRRGYNSSVVCMSCGESIKCPNCSVSMTFHTVRSLGLTSDEGFEERRQKSGLLICHYCGHKERVPLKCPSCGKEHFRYNGCGTQMLEEEIKRLIPSAVISRMDMDTTSTKLSHSEILDVFRSGKTNVLLGTQMVAKGHDFPKVTLVGVLGADSSLYLDDYRAAERTFSMLTQVIGRAGRKGGDEGVAVVQTLSPDSDVIRYAALQDYKSFYQKEIRFRKNLLFPPFCDLAVFTVSSSDEALLSASSLKLLETLKLLLAEKYTDIKLQAFGPFENPVYRISNICRMRLVVKCRLTKRFREMTSELLCDFGKSVSKKVTLSVDFNPNTL